MRIQLPKFSILSTMFSRSIRKTVKLTVSPLVWILVVGLLAGCDDNDPFRGSATIQNTIVSVGVPAFSSGLTGSSGIDLLNQRLVKPELSSNGAVNFQMAVDIEPTGEILLLPVLSLLSPPQNAMSVGFQKSEVGFDELLKAPVGNYRMDAGVITETGVTWLIQLNSGTCAFGDALYGKFEVEEVNRSARRAFIRFMINRNCGYRDLTLGIPRN